MNDPTDLLDIEEIARNIAQLDERVRIRFDGHSIVKRSGRLVQLAERAITRSRELALPRYFVRAICVLDILLMIAALGAAGYFAARTLKPLEQIELADLLQAVEAGIGCAVFLVVVLAFFVTLEKRLRRNAVLKELEPLRSFLHLVNMGQLDKEPVRLDMGFETTEKSPPLRLDARAMERYLSQTQKLAHYAAEIGCVYANVILDPEVDRMADELREFASDVARAAGDKITILTLKVLSQTAQP